MVWGEKVEEKRVDEEDGTFVGRLMRKVWRQGLAGSDFETLVEQIYNFCC